MYLLSKDHFDKLLEKAGNDPMIQELYDMGIKAFQAYEKVYQGGTNVSGNYRLYTAQMEELLKELSGRLARRWDASIVIEYDVNSPEYQSLMQEGRSVFQQGAYDVRISKVIALAEQLKQFPVLEGLQQEVEKFAARLQETRQMQQRKEFRSQEQSDELESKRKALATIMHGIYGGLIKLYYTERQKIEQFYELKYLRAGSREDTEETITLNLSLQAGESQTVLEDQLQEGILVRLTNTSTQPVSAYLSDATEARSIETGLAETFIAKIESKSLTVKNEGESTATILVEVLP